MFKLGITAFIGVTLLVGCNKSPSGAGTAQVPVTTQNLKGSWELITTTVGNVTSSAGMDSAAFLAGYRDGAQKFQFSITESKFRRIDADELTVNGDVEANYKLEGTKIVPQDSPNLKMTAFVVVSLTPNTMTVTSPGASNPAGLQFNLVRISDQDLAVNKLAPIPQNMNLTFPGPNGMLSQSMVGILNRANPQPTGTGTNVECSIKQHRLKVSTITYEVGQKGEFTVNNESPSLNFEADVSFNFSNQIEKLPITAAQGPAGTGFGAYFKHDSTEAVLQLAANGKCAGYVTRTKRMLGIDLECDQVNVNPVTGLAATTNPVHLTVSGQCALMFQ